MSTAQSFTSPLFQPIVPMDGGTYSIAPGYKATFYAAGTTTPKTIYQNPGLSVPYPSPSWVAVLDDQGSALIYLGAGGYKLVLTTAGDVPVPGWTIDNIQGGSSFGTGFVNSFAELAAVNTTLNPYTYIGGYYEPGDGGEGMFYNVTSSDSADGGYIQTSTFDTTKRWFRIPDESGKVRTASFGAIGLSVNHTDSVLAADSYAATYGLTLLVNTPARVNNMTFTAPSVEFVEGAFIRGWTAATVTFNGTVYGPDAIIFSHTIGGGLDVVLANASQQSNPYWFEASPDASGAENLAAMTKWLAAGAGVFVVPGGDYTYTGTFPTVDTPTLFYGTINGERQGIQFGANDSVARFGSFTASDGGNSISGDGAGGMLTDGNWSVSGELNVGKAGTGVSYYRVGGSLARSAPTYGSVAFAGTTPIYSQVIQANSLSRNGDKIHVILQGTYTGDWTGVYGNVVVKIGGLDTLFGGSPLLYLSGNSGAFRAEFDLVRVSETEAIAYPIGWDYGAGSTYPIGINSGTKITLPGTGWAQNQTLAVEGNRGGSPATGAGYLNFVDVSILAQP